MWWVLHLKNTMVSSVVCVFFTAHTQASSGEPPLGGMGLFVVRLMILVCESTSHLPKVEAVVRLVWHG